MDWSNLTLPQVGFVAAMATIASGFVAATAALVSTGIAGWNNRRLQAQVALREYRLRLMQTALDEAEARLRAISLILIARREIQDTLYPGGLEPLHRKVFVTPTDELHAAAKHFALWDHYCWAVFSSAKGRRISDSQRECLLTQLEESVLVFREAVENFAFGRHFSRAVNRRLQQRRTESETSLKRLLQDIDAQPVESNIPARPASSATAEKLDCGQK